MAGKFMKNWSAEQIDFYAGKKKSPDKKFYKQERPITDVYQSIVKVGVIPFTFTPGGTKPNIYLPVTMTEQAQTILALVDAATETNLTAAVAKMAGTIPSGYIFIPAKVCITLWDGQAGTTGVSGLTGKTGIKKFKTRSGSIPYGDTDSSNEYPACRSALANKILVKKDEAGNKVKAMTFKPEMLKTSNLKMAKAKENLTPTNAALTYTKA